MNRLAEMIAKGEISVEELATARDLISRAELVVAGIEACKKTIVFPLGETTVNCYQYTDNAGEYEAWGTCSSDGVFKCSCNWGGNHQIGSCNLLIFESVFMAFENRDFSHDLKRFLKRQIEKAETVNRV